MSNENDFPSRAHCLVRWYGLRHFLVLAPSAGSEALESESRIKLLLSSIAITLTSTGCQVPVFVHSHARWRKLYFGLSCCAGFMTSYESVHLARAPSQYNHLTGLLDVFKAKIACPVNPLPPVQVSVRFTYVLADWTHLYTWSQQPPDMDSMVASEVGCTEFGDLPFGACEDPITDLQLSTTWPCLSEDMIVENDVYSDLDALQAPHWTVKVRFLESPQVLMGDYLQEFLHLCECHESTDQLLSKALLEPDDSSAEGDISQVLQRLTQPTVSYNLPSIGTVVTKATSKLQMKPEEAPIPSDMLSAILMFLFPDAKEPEQTDQGEDDVMEPPPEANSDSMESQDHPLLEKLSQLKSSGIDSLPWRLAVCMCIVNHSHGGLRAVAHLWQEFVLEMRYRWENNHTVPDVEQGAPNMGSSLIHQKLQMLNVCIQRKRDREAMLGISQSGSGGNMKNAEEALSVGSVSSEEEFFECPETASQFSIDENKDAREPTEKAMTQSGSGRRRRTGSETSELSEKDDDHAKRLSVMSVSSADTEAESSYRDTLPHQPDGRLRKCGDLKLLAVDAPLFIPITQEPAHMTEDMLEEQAEVLAKLGTSAEGAHLRARMQSACLLSDMESFKAANPGSTLGDFVRWYSPRDWVEEEVVEETGQVTKKAVKGQLSPRMQIPGNMWVEVWQSARPVPARKQRRLFDDTKEAEKVLHWLSAMKPSEAAQRLLPMLAHCALLKLMNQDESKLPVMQTVLEQAISKTAKVTRLSKPSLKHFGDLVNHLTQAETFITRAQSLLTKFEAGKAGQHPTQADLAQFVSNLLQMPEVTIPGAARAPAGKVIHALFAAAQKANSMLPEDENNGDQENETDVMDTTSNSRASDFPVPAGREYILRTTLSCPAPWSRLSPQRMYCSLIKEEFRLIGAFTSDTTFQ
eukprot:GHVU01164295.1.p1 GENE.GHVU01164295.1~~GHVU01164295.1.p1  ORF type:complete len:938 (+),score=116.09 GHVU01164295.1:61-2814(+)